MSLSRVKSVQATGSFENDYGVLQENGKKLLYKFEYEMEDGKVLTANHKTNTSPFPAGSEVEYEITKTHAEHGMSGKVKKPDTGNYQGGSKPSVPFKGGLAEDARQLMICRQSSLNRAVELLTHSTPNSEEIDTVRVVELAERLAKWVMQPEKKAETPAPTVADLPVVEEESDDLPF